MYIYLGFDHNGVTALVTSSEAEATKWLREESDEYNQHTLIRVEGTPLTLSNGGNLIRDTDV